MDDVAVQLLAKQLHKLPHPNGVVNMPHPGVISEEGIDMLPFGRQAGGVVRTMVAQAILYLLEQSGYLILDGLDGAAKHLQDHGYIVVTPEGS